MIPGLVNLSVLFIAFFTALNATAATPGVPDLEYFRLGDRKSHGTLTVMNRPGDTLVSLRQFCFALGCHVLYQWANHRAIVQNPNGRLGAIVSTLTHVALVDGKVLDFQGQVVSDLREGYLLPLDLAEKLALALRLGRIERREKRSEPHPIERATALNTIVLDPGHGGSDWGTGFGNIYEKDVSVIYALKLRDELRKAIPDVDVILTRDDDRYISLPDRAKFANAKNANLFLSLHVNHAPDPKVEGVETYILSPEATDDDAKKVALIENDSWLKTAKIKEAGETVRKILVDMEQTKYIQHSALAAALIQQELARLVPIYGLKNRGVKQAMFYVLSQAAMPSALVEMGFLSSTGDRSRLMDIVFRDDFVKSIVSALKRYKERQDGKLMPSVDRSKKDAREVSY